MKNHPDIIVRKADKANVFVIMDKNEYNQKLESIIHDTTKFRKLTKNPIPELKVKMNNLIETANI